MKTSKTPLWKRSMLSSLNLDSINEFLYEILENGDRYGYEYENNGSEYYRDYKELFDILSDGAYRLMESLCEYSVRENWDDMTVALLGELHTVFGYDNIEKDYYRMSSFEETLAQREAVKRIERLTKKEIIICFRKVMTTLVLFFDIKAAHDCLTSIVEELDERGALLQNLYKKMSNGEDDKNNIMIPQRMWVE